MAPVPAVDMQDVRFAWGGGRFAIAVDDFRLEQGEHLLLTAPSGAGKSTLIALIAGVVQPQSGAIRIAGTDIVPMRASQRDAFRADSVGLIFQSFNLIPYLTALDNIVIPLSFAARRLKRLGGWSKASAQARVMLDDIGLPAARFSDQKAGQLSIGQQQRVAVLRALIGGPGLVMADEPTSALDRDHQQAFLKLLRRQTTQSGAGLIMVSHDLSLAPLFDRTAELGSFARAELRA